MAFRDLWGAYAFACGRFGIDPGPRPSGNGSAFSGIRGGAKTSTQAPSLTRTFLESTQQAADGLGWFAELGAQIVRDIIREHGLEKLPRSPTQEPPPDFESYFKNRKLRL
ncbi:MAG: hypothetical protein H6862_03380 [Rhodospirillales bacterium]|nr:hypothetical protein [Rhodospirillales bacterium]